MDYSSALLIFTAHGLIRISILFHCIINIMNIFKDSILILICDNVFYFFQLIGRLRTRTYRRWHRNPPKILIAVYQLN